MTPQENLKTLETRLRHHESERKSIMDELKSIRNQASETLKNADNLFKTYESLLQPENVSIPTTALSA